MERLAVLSPAAVSIIVLIVALAIAALWWAVVGSRDASTRTRGPTVSPWLVVAIVMVVLGVVVAPRLLGFTFIFLPFIWMNRGRRSGGPRGRGSRDGGAGDDERDHPDGRG